MSDIKEIKMHWWNEIARTEGHCGIICHRFPGGHYYNGARMGSYHAPVYNERVVVIDGDNVIVAMSDCWAAVVTPALIKAGEKAFELFTSTKWAGKMWFDEERAYALSSNGYVRNETQLGG